MSYDGKEMDRVATFIPLETDKEAAERRKSAPNSARLTSKKDNQTLQSESSVSLNEDVAEYIKTLINTVLLQLSGQKQPFVSPVTSETESDEQPFGSPATSETESEEQPLGSPAINETESEEQPFGSPVTNETESERQPFRSPVINETEYEEQPFGSPVTNGTEFVEMPFQSPVVGEERREKYYTPRSDDDKDDTSQRITQDDFEIDDDTGSLEFALKDLPIQEDPESPVRSCLSAQLIAEIDNTLNTILNLEESAELVEGYSVDETDSAILIDYNDENQLENSIAELSYYCNTSKVDEYSTKTQGVVTSPDRQEYPMTADIEETFNILLQMTHRSENEASGAMYDSSLAGAISDDVFLRARFPYLEDSSGISLHKSIKTPDVTQVEGRPMDMNPLVSSESTDDEDEKRTFVFMNDFEIKNYLLSCDKYKEKRVNGKKSAKKGDTQPVIIEMDKRGTRSHEEFRNRSPVHPVRKRGRIRSFFRRAASALGLIKTRSWSPSKDDNNCNRAKTDDRIEFMTTSFGGEPGDYISSNTLSSSSMAPHEGKLAPASEIGESVDQDMVKSSRKAPKRRCREQLVYNHHQGVLEY